MKKSKVAYVTLSQGEEQAFKICLDDFELDEPDKKLKSLVNIFFDGSQEMWMKSFDRNCV